jgi:hypothetical protein
MSRAQERRPVDGTPTPRRTPRPVHGVPDEVGPELGELREALGNAAMSRLLDPRTSDAIEANLGGGVPLATATGASPARADDDADGASGSRLGPDRDVRVHDDATAADLSRRLGAVAFTFGRDIFLAADAPDLDSAAGARLISHELTHVRQQQATGTTRPRRVSAPGSPAEREAAHASQATRAAAPTGAQTVHRQASAGEEQEEEVMTMAADTVHRQVATEEDELEAEASEAGPTVAPTESTPALTGAGAVAAGSEQAAGPTGRGEAAGPATTNPAASALYEAAVMDKLRLAVASLQSTTPDPLLAHRELGDAARALAALALILWVRSWLTSVWSTAYACWSGVPGGNAYPCCGT